MLHSFGQWHKRAPVIALGAHESQRFPQVVNLGILALKLAACFPIKFSIRLCS